MSEFFGEFMNNDLPGMKPRDIVDWMTSGNPSQQSPQSNRPWTEARVLSNIQKISTYDPERASKMFSDLQYLKTDKNSKYYNPYAQATNKSVAALNAYGIDTSKIDNDFFDRNQYLTQYLIYNGTSNSPTKPGAKATAAQKAAYEYYQIWKSEENTIKAEKQWEDLQKELKYWTTRKDLNLSDEEVLARVNWDNYKELASMDANKYIEPNEYNRAIGYSQDAMRAIIWMARQDNFSGSLEDAMINSYRGNGAKWVDDPTVTAKRNKGDINTYDRYSLGMTLDEEGQYFDMPYFTEEWLNEQREPIMNGGDATAQKYYTNVYNAFQTTKKAKEELEKLNAQVDKWCSNDKLDEKTILANLDRMLGKADYSTLRKMDETLASGGELIKMTEAVPYRKQDIIAEIHNRIEARGDRDDKNKTLAKAQIPEMNEYGKEMQARGWKTPQFQSPAEKMSEDIANKNAAISSDILYDDMSDVEKRHFDQQPDINAKQAAEALYAFKKSKLPGAPVQVEGAPEQPPEQPKAQAPQEETPNAGNPFEGLAPIRKEIKEDPTWLLKMAQARVQEADEKYKDVALSSLRTRTSFETAQAKVESLTSTIDEIESKYSDLELAHEPIPYEPQVELDPETGVTLNFVLKEDGKYELDPDFDRDNPAINDFLVRNNMTQEDLQTRIDNEQEALDAKAAMIRRAKEKTRVDDPYGAAQQEKFFESLPDLQVLKAQQAYYQKYVDEHQSEYDKAKADLTAAEKPRTLLRGVVLRTGNPVASTAALDNTLDFMGSFTDYKSPDADADGTVGGLENRFIKKGAFTDEDRAEVNAQIKKLQEIVDGTNTLANFEDTPGDYKKWMGSYVADTQAQIRLLKNFLMTKEEGYEEVAQKGFDQYWQDRSAEFEEYDTAVTTPGIGWNVMTDYEKNLFYAIYGTQGAEAAQQFYQDIEDSLIVRSKEGFQRNADARSNDYWGRKLNTILSIGLAAAEVPASAMYLMGSALHGEGNEWLRMPSYISKESFQQNIEKFHEIYKGTVWDVIIPGMAEMFYNRGRSAVVGAMFGPLLPAGASDVVHAMPIASIAMADALDEAFEAGAEPWQAWTIAGVHFISEAWTEGIKLKNMEKALKMGSLKLSTLKDYFVSRVPDGVSEMLGESLNDLSEMWVNDAVMGEKGERAQKIRAYVNAGYMPDQAELMTYVDDFSQIMHTAAISYLSSFLDIGGFAWSKMKTNLQYGKQYIKLRKAGDTTTTLKEIREKDIKSLRDIQARAEKSNEEALSRDLKPFFASEREGINPARLTTKAQKGQQAEYDTDITILANASNSDKGTVTDTLAAILRTDNMNADQAMAAAEALSEILGEDTLGAMMELWQGGIVSGTNIQTLRLALQYAALTDGKCRAVMTGNAFTQGTPEAKAKYLSESVVQDMNNPTMQSAMAEAVRENRIAEVEQKLMGQNDVRERLEHTQTDLAYYEAKTHIAQENLDKQRTVEKALSDKVSEAGTNMANDPSDANRLALERARNELKHQRSLREQAEQTLKNAETDEQNSRNEADRVKQEVRAEIRAQAEEAIAQEDIVRQQEAEKAALEEQERIKTEDALREASNVSRLVGERVAENFTNLSEEDQEKIVQMAMDMQSQINNDTVDSILARKNFREGIAKRFNLTAREVDTDKFNARIDRNTGELLVSKNATQSDIMYAVLVHEITHLAEGSDTYSELADAVLTIRYGDGVTYSGILDAMNRGDLTSKMARDILAKKTTYDAAKDLTGGKIHSYEDMLQEIVADTVGAVIAGDQKALDIIAQKPSLARRFIAAIRSFVRKMKGIEGEPVTKAMEIAKMLEAKVKEAEGKTGNTKYSLSNEYQTAVKNNDREMAQRLVAEAAKGEGFDTSEYAYHGTNTFGFTEFDMAESQNEIFVAYGKSLASTYTNTKNVREIGNVGQELKGESGPDIVDYLKANGMYMGTTVLEASYNEADDTIHMVLRDDQEGHDSYGEENAYDIPSDIVLNNIKFEAKHQGGIYKFYTRPGNQLVIDGQGANWNKITVPWTDEIQSTRSISKYAKENGYDSVRINNIYDNGAFRVNGSEGYGDIGIFFFQDDVKSADPITYDSDGNVIPIEDRFSYNNDFRYSLPEEHETIDDKEGEPVADVLRGGTVALDQKYSLNSFTPKERDQVRHALYNAKNPDGTNRFTHEQVDKYIQDAMGIAAKIAGDRIRLDFEVTDPNKSMWKANSDYGGTIDASTLCAKRLVYQGTFDAIQHLLPNTPLMPEDLIHLADVMREMGYETPCGICYVESRRRNLDNYINEWLQTFKGTENDDFIPKIEDVSTTDGLENVRKNHPETYDAFMEAMNSHGKQNNPKPVQLRTEYKGEIRNLNDKQIQKYINNGGIRLQSFSDFETPHLLDMVQVVMDIASKNMTAQAYTKVPNFAWVFGDTGIKINLSLIGKGTGVDENGNLIFDDVEGMPFEEAMKLRNRYSKNVGTVLVGMNDAHILAAMADPRIDYIIPFHSSGWTKDDMKLMHKLDGYTDYQNFQTEKDVSTGAKTTRNKGNNLKPVGQKDDYGNGYWDFSKSGKENAEAYLDICYKNGLIPVFSRFLDQDETGHYRLKADGSTDGYWKLLIDFKMYDNDGVGSSQTAVTPDINMNQAYHVLSNYSLERKQPNAPAVKMENNNTLPKAMPVVERIYDEYKDRERQFAEERNSNRKYSLPSDIPYLDAVGRGDTESAQRMVDEKANKYLESLLLPDDSDEAGFKFHRGPAPTKTFKRYAVLNVSKDGFRAAYAGNKNPTPMGVWLDAQNLESYMSDVTQFDDGSFATYIIGDTGASAKDKFSPELLAKYGIKPSQNLLLERGGKHSSDVPNFSQMNLKRNELGEKVSSAKNGALPHNKLIFEIEYGISDDGDLTDYVRENGRMMNGRNQGLANIEPNKYYDFKTNPNAVGNWGIGGTFRITRLVPYSEVVEKTAQYKQDAVEDAKRLYENGKISKSDMQKRIKNANAIQLQKWVGGYHPEDFGLSVDLVNEMVQDGYNKKLTDAITYDDNGNVIPLSERFNINKKDARYSLPSDAHYMSAVERGDMETADRMVLEAAQNAGYNLDVYHGTDANFTEFKVGDLGYHVGTKEQAEDRIHKVGLRSTQDTRSPHIMHLFAKLQNPLVIDHDFGDWHGKNVAEMLLETEQFEEGYDENAEEINARLREIAKMPDGAYTDRVLREYLQSLGYDGIDYENQFEDVDREDSIVDDFERSYIVFDSSQLKYADPVTYDDNGNVIPLSERFNEQNPDIRYSLPSDAPYMSAVERGDTEMAKSLLDERAKEAGYLYKGFHGTNAVFDYFDPEKLGSKNFMASSARMGFFAAASRETAESYTGLNSMDTMALYLNPDVQSKMEEIKAAHNFDERSRQNNEAQEAFFNEYKRTHGFTESVDQPLEVLTQNGLISDETVLANVRQLFEIHWNEDNLNDMLNAWNETQEAKDFEAFSQEIYNEWEQYEIQRRGYVPNVKELYIKMENPFIYDFNGEGRDTESFAARMAYAKEHGYDGCIFKNVADGADLDTIYTVFSNTQFKSADPVTYDDDGNVIPLSERFNEQKQSLRYSLPNDDILQEQVKSYLSGIRGTPDATAMPLEGQTWQDGSGPAQRQFGQGMLQESDEIDQQVKDFIKRHNGYFPDTNEDQINRAIKWIKRNRMTDTDDGFYGSLQKVTSDGFDYRSADGQARMVATMALAVAKNDLMAQVALTDAFNRQGTDLGRALQARKLFRMMTPAGRMSALADMLRKTQAELDRKGIKIDLKFSDWVYQAAAVATQEGDFEKVYNAAAAQLAEQIPANWRDKLRAWRMLSMLANPRTHIRNVLGNMLFTPAVGLKNKIAAVMELGLEHGERTKTLSPILRSDIRAFAREQADANEALLRGEAKYNEGNPVKREQKPFKGFMQKIIDANGKALEFEDWVFLKGHFRRAFGGWVQGNGYTVEQVKNDPILLEKATSYAINEAQKATYRDFSKIAALLNKASRDGGIGGFIVDAALPFKKTPANILKRGIEYSPASIMRSFTTDLYHLKQWSDYKNGKLNALPDKAISPSQWIDRLCTGLSGSAILTLGALLSRTGFISCGLDDDEDKFEKAKGAQKYAFKFTIGGQDFSYTIDWAAPMSMPFFVGAAIEKMIGKDADYDLEVLLNAFGNITEPVFNLSMLDGVNTLFKTSQFEETNTLTQIGARLFSNYFTSYVPSALGAITRINDTTQRKNFVESGKGTGILGTLRYAREQVENKIPGLSRTNIPVRNIWGEPNVSSSAEAHIENLVSPGYSNPLRGDPIIDEMHRLYEITQDKDMIPEEDPPKSFSYRNNKYVLTDQQWDRYKEVRGKTAFKELTELINSDAYRNAGTTAQKQMISDVWKHADGMGRKAIVPEYDVMETPVEEIAAKSKITGLENDMMTCLNDGDYVGFDTMVEALREEGVEDTDIVSKIRGAYQNPYKDAYRMWMQTGDSKYKEQMADIVETLSATEFEDRFDFDGWEEKVNEKYGF